MIILTQSQVHLWCLLEKMLQTKFSCQALYLEIVILFLADW